MVLCKSPEEVRQEETTIAILHCSGLLCVVACSEVEAGVEAEGSLLSAHPFILACNAYTDCLYSLSPATHFV